MRIVIDRESAKAIYVQIFEQIRRQILAGELQPGFRLPSERSLAESLGVNRTTVLNAYRELKADNLISSLVGNGTMVLPCREGSDSAYLPREPAWNQIFSQYADRLKSVLVKELLELANRNDVISFATGIASPESGPIQALLGIEREIVEGKNYRPLIHSPTEGILSMRKALCALMQKRGVYCQPDAVMMLSGSQQGIDLAARIFLDPGDIVVVEEPTYFPAIQAFSASGARIMSVPVDEKGMRVDLLEQLLQRYRPKMIYTIPTFQNPTGTELDLERRKRLVELSLKYHVMILEDDAYGDLRYDDDPLPSLKSLDSSGYVIYLSTFSKNIYSGLRLGWIVAHKNVVKKFSSAKQLVDLHSSSLSQWIIQRFVESGSLEAHVAKICREYRSRRDIMHEALCQYAPPDLIWNKPQGGYYIWCKLPDDLSSAQLVSKAADYQVSFVPGAPFFVSGQGDHYIRLNFTFAPVEKIEAGIRRLCAAMKELADETDKNNEHLLSEISPVI